VIVPSTLELGMARKALLVAFILMMAIAGKMLIEYDDDLSLLQDNASNSSAASEKDNASVDRSKFAETNASNVSGDTQIDVLSSSKDKANSVDYPLTAELLDETNNSMSEIGAKIDNSIEQLDQEILTGENVTATLDQSNVAEFKARALRLVKHKLASDEASKE